MAAADVAARNELGHQHPRLSRYGSISVPEGLNWNRVLSRTDVMDDGYFMRFQCEKSFG